MKKISLLSLLGFLLLPSIALAQLHSYGSLTLNGLIPNILNVLWIVFTAFAVIMFVVSGIMFLTAQGDREKLVTARASLYWGVVGVIVGIVAYSAVAIITSILV